MLSKLRGTFSLSRKYKTHHSQTTLTPRLSSHHLGRPHLLSSTLTLSALSLAYMARRHHNRSQSSTLCCIALRENLSAVQIDHIKSTIALSARQCGGFAAETRVQRWGNAGAWVYLTLSKRECIRARF